MAQFEYSLTHAGTYGILEPGVQPNYRGAAETTIQYRNIKGPKDNNVRGVLSGLVTVDNEITRVAWVTAGVTHPRIVRELVDPELPGVVIHHEYRDGDATLRFGANFALPTSSSYETTTDMLFMGTSWANGKESPLTDKHKEIVRGLTLGIADRIIDLTDVDVDYIGINYSFGGAPPYSEFGKLIVTR